MKKVNFNSIDVENIDGSIAKLNIRKDFANALYSNGKTLDVVELARKIWHSEEEAKYVDEKTGKEEIKVVGKHTELTEEEVKIVEENVKQFYPSYIIQTAIINAIK